jgi:hypothetical protein
MVLSLEPLMRSGRDAVCQQAIGYLRHNASGMGAWLADLQHPRIWGGQSIESFAKAALSRPHPPAVSGAFVTPEILDSSTGNEVRRAGDHRIAVS